jgi:membrane protease YdiL (CAAX protease family)
MVRKEFALPQNFRKLQRSMNEQTAVVEKESGAADPRVRFTAVMEVVLVFAVTHVAIKAFKQFTALGSWERAARLNFSPGLFFGAVAIAVLLVTRRDLKAYGLGLRRHRPRLGWGVRVVVALMLYLVPLGLFLRQDPQPLHGLVTFLGFIGVVAIGEELFFRGYLQSRLNAAFGRPWQARGISFGPGLILTSLIFGFLHSLNTVDYFHGRFHFDWGWAALTTVAGLIFGFIREATGSIWPGAVVHGLLDVWTTALTASGRVWK